MRGSRLLRGSMNWRSASPDRYLLLKAFAKENRRYMTEAESVLWGCLKGNALGHKFLRQHIIGDYIVDFLCRDKMLVLEVDGGYHSERTQQEDDAVRQKWLESIGYKVIRFSNEEVLLNLESTLQTIKLTLLDYTLSPKQGD